jgi:RimJ/RimL family protein N-acetyltransferase
MKHIPKITTERLCLRPFTAEDRDVLTELAGDHDIASSTLRIPHPYEKKNADEWISTHRKACETDTEIIWAVTNKYTNLLAGSISLMLDVKNEKGELGYWIGKQYWGNGYCTEASKAILKFAFENLKLHRVFAKHLKNHSASGKVLRKIGMLYEGTLVGHIKKWGKFEDIALYGMIKDDYVKP